MAETNDGQVKVGLARVWEIFGYYCSFQSEDATYTVSIIPSMKKPFIFKSSARGLLVLCEESKV
jgi:hypothetical protein